MPFTVLHISAALLSVLLGAVILLARKGTPRHRHWGRMYGFALLVMVASSFFVTDLRDGWSVFHVVSVLTGALVLCGWWQPVFGRSRAGWVRRHMLSMQLSYLVLIVTGTAQFFDYLPLPNDALNAIVVLQLPLMVGIVAIIRRSRRPIGTHGSLPSSP
ncbi:DUF2306 domain-containing protein [Rhodococcoides fascians A25f]|uniref:DUF2306 domain-containing protein n=1 Tax=Rhodococcoides fascians TaxID=1828 RepID=UPI00068CE39B|nr:DUF2306 domain-containing protein [Rhodococcus fascians]QII06829.1 DUF2306 domain-containing protein [Rhodococcus fascians A25f]